jgi:hypothetical protein
MEIRSGSRVPIMPLVIQPTTKLVSPLRGGTSLEFISLPVWTFTILILVTTIANQPLEGSERSDKKHDKLDNLID